MDEQTKETVLYMKGMSEYSKREIARYVRGVYDGVQTVKQQYGLSPESCPAGQGKVDYGLEQEPPRDKGAA
jgi:hypothetical protein